MRRNNVCYLKKDWDNGRIVYGRINRRIDNDHFEVIDTGKFVTVTHRDKIILAPDYTGYEDHRGRWHRMPSLRKIKQAAQTYNKAVWKKFRSK